MQACFSHIVKASELVKRLEKNILPSALATKEILSQQKVMFESVSDLFNQIAELFKELTDDLEKESKSTEAE